MGRCSSAHIFPGELYLDSSSTHFALDLQHKYGGRKFISSVLGYVRHHSDAVRDSFR